MSAAIFRFFEGQSEDAEASSPDGGGVKKQKTYINEGINKRKKRERGGEEDEEGRQLHSARYMYHTITFSFFFVSGKFGFSCHKISQGSLF